MPQNLRQSQAEMEWAPWLAISPGLAIGLAVLSFNLFGDTLRDAWDPTLRRRSQGCSGDANIRPVAVLATGGL